MLRSQYLFADQKGLFIVMQRLLIAALIIKGACRLFVTHQIRCTVIDVVLCQFAHRISIVAFMYSMTNHDIDLLKLLKSINPIVTVNITMVHLYPDKVIDYFAVMSRLAQKRTGSRYFSLKNGAAVLLSTAARVLEIELYHSVLVGLCITATSA